MAHFSEVQMPLSRSLKYGNSIPQRECIFLLGCVHGLWCTWVEILAGGRLYLLLVSRTLRVGVAIFVSEGWEVVLLATTNRLTIERVFLSSLGVEKRPTYHSIRLFSCFPWRLALFPDWRFLLTRWVAREWNVNLSTALSAVCGSPKSSLKRETFAFFWYRMLTHNQTVRSGLRSPCPFAVSFTALWQTYGIGCS